MNLSDVLEQVGRERSIDRRVLVETLEAALKTAAKRVFGEGREIEAEYNEETGAIDLFLCLTVAETVEDEDKDISLKEVRDRIDPSSEVGDEMLFHIYYRDEDFEKAREQTQRYGDLLRLEAGSRTFGRIAAQTAKQVIIQRVREAERQNIYEEFKDKKNELIVGVVRRFEKGNIIVDLGRAEAILPNSEQTRRESYRPGDRIQGFVKDVVKGGGRDAPIILSRTDPGLVIKLFEQEVPEIGEGIVQIVAIAREPGVRSKVAVYSTDSDVDPVGACVGMRGSRVQAVVQELRGEKIDIVPYSSEPARWVCNAISPAHVSKVHLDDSNMSMELIVPDDQLSLAIGRGGQNVRLAAQLTAWNLEILSESRLRQMTDEAKQQLLEFEGITEQMVDTVFSLGFTKVVDVGLADPTEIARMPGFNPERAELVIAAAAQLSAKAAEEEAIPEEGIGLEVVAGVTEDIADALFEAGYTQPLELYFEEEPSRMADLVDILDIDAAAEILAAAQTWYDAQGFDEETQAAHEDEAEEFQERQEARLEAAASEPEAESEEPEAADAEPAEAAPAESTENEA